MAFIAWFCEAVLTFFSLARYDMIVVNDLFGDLFWRSGMEVHQEHPELYHVIVVRRFAVSHADKLLGISVWNYNSMLRQRCLRQIASIIKSLKLDFIIQTENIVKIL